MHDLPALLRRLGIDPDGVNPGLYVGSFSSASPKPPLASFAPRDGAPIASVSRATREDYERAVRSGEAAFREWRSVPAPVRGELVRQLGDELRRVKDDLGALVSLECGKILTEGRGEVQEMIDIADFACGLSRQLYGLSMHSERPQHRMFEQWHPLGTVGCITAFNFPVAVWAWNAFIAAVCGDVTLWKPSEKTPLCAVAVNRIVDRVLERNGRRGIMNCVIGDVPDVGEPMLDDPRIALVSATGSTRMGRIVGPRVAARFGRSLLELGGNNAIIVMDDADLSLALSAVLFGAVGTAGQRCTTTRRLFLHPAIAKRFTESLVAAYAKVRIGDPLDDATLCGPLIDADAVAGFRRALDEIRRQGGEVLCGGRVLDRPGFYVEPTIVRAPLGFAPSREEVFAPILYVFETATLDDAIRAQNDVPQGLSSAVFTDSVRRAETFLSPAGSDCGIANVNIGTSGAEIGGAFGGEKETGGGRESGSDAWKQYMRRQTCTVNWGTALPLAQGVSFRVE
ncbi:MAG: Succinate-semialdehyde dehydrogenase [NADP(+)] GabD [Planctomycetes bacterium]|nr:Succinate-semialdehyde dehydrogenase [NADP(+)] GabD [Planctomycetota bacterium]